jgi:hypothetical protein
MVLATSGPDSVKKEPFLQDFGAIEKFGNFFEHVVSLWGSFFLILLLDETSAFCLHQTYGSIALVKCIMSIFTDVMRRI